MFYDKVFLYYDGPRVFSLKNSVGFTYLGYWVGDTDACESWWLIPISPSRLKKLAANKIDIRSALEQQEENFFYRVDFYFDDGRVDTAVEYSREAKNLITLPLAGIFLDLEVKETVPTHKLRIAKSSKAVVGSLSLSDTSKVQAAFNKLAENITRWVSASPLIQPIDAAEGSFVLSFSSEELGKIQPILSELSVLLKQNVDPIEFVSKYNVNPKVLASLLREVSMSEVVLQLCDAETNEFFFDISYDELEESIDALDRYSSSLLSSSLVPQANNISRIISALEIIYSGDDLSRLGVSDRQVKYYLQAVRLLGLTDNDSSLTPFGRLLVSSSEDAKLKGLLSAFELSECGKAWVSWSGVSDINEVEPGTAIAFLNDCCPELRGQSTLLRRASTIRGWLRKCKN